MVLTIALILTATIAVGALEIWLFWRLGERDDRRRRCGRPQTPSSEPEPDEDTAPGIGEPAARAARLRGALDPIGSMILVSASAGAIPSTLVQVPVDEFGYGDVRS